MLFWDFTVQNGSFLPTFQDNLSVPSSQGSSSLAHWSLKMGSTGCSRRLVRNYHSTLHQISRAEISFTLWQKPEITQNCES